MATGTPAKPRTASENRTSAHQGNRGTPPSDTTSAANWLSMAIRYAVPENEATKATHLICWRTSPPERR